MARGLSRGPETRDRSSKRRPKDDDDYNDGEEEEEGPRHHAHRGRGEKRQSKPVCRDESEDEVTEEDDDVEESSSRNKAKTRLSREEEQLRKEGTRKLVDELRKKLEVYLQPDHLACDGKTLTQRTKKGYLTLNYMLGAPKVQKFKNKYSLNDKALTHLGKKACERSDLMECAVSEGELYVRLKKELWTPKYEEIAQKTIADFKELHERNPDLADQGLASRTHYLEKLQREYGLPRYRRRERKEKDDKDDDGD
eukprot:Sspe_Gene.89611::Locus_61348_Transcript_2_3_Confidence_0.400_Length_826::g.89611::m.89611